ncbi:hypothetical protein ACF0H5_015921 [Mactra antiquata]
MKLKVVIWGHSFVRRFLEFIEEYVIEGNMGLDKQLFQDMDIEGIERCDNLRFYRNEILSRPPRGYTIEIILQHYGDYKFLDEYPYFIKWSSHPELRRITRVLTSLGELGCKRYQVHLIGIFIKNKKDIVEFEWITVLYWIDTVKDVGEREKLFEKYGKQVFSDKTLNSFSRPTDNSYNYDDYEHDRTLKHLNTV